MYYERFYVHTLYNSGIIYVDGAVVQSVKSENETLDALKRGALSRTVGSTNMNAQSSRSHAIFTLSVSQKRQVLHPVSFLEIINYHLHVRTKVRV